MTDVIDIINIIRARQRAWAQRQQRALDKDGYCGCADDNVFQGLSDAARADLTRGGGRELGAQGERGKFQAAHSSSALACNWFDYWRERDFGVLSAAFNVPTPFVTLRLEVHVPTGMRGADANLDVLLTTADGWLFAIESKYTEPYTRAQKPFLKPQYFSQNRSRWTDVGLPGCQDVAEQIRSGHHRYTMFDVAQTLKHMLALGRTGSRWTLCCLWYEVPGAAADTHRAELQQFAAQIGADNAHFTALTYQELFARMEPLAGGEHADYIAYLRDRYIEAEA
jgi:hypothetical protein